MHASRVKLKDGREFSGPVWSFQPRAGFFSLVDEEGVNGGSPIEIRFSEVESAVSLANRVSVKEADVDVDLLDRARKEGWDGK